MKRLTPKQQKFAREYFRTGNASEAYRLAYDAKNMKPETVNRNAVELTQNSMIAARIDELRVQAELIAIRDKNYAVNKLWQWAEESEKDRAQVMKLIAKIMGWEAPTRQQIEAAFVSPFEKFMEAAPESQPETEPDSGD